MTELQITRDKLAIGPLEEMSFVSFQCSSCKKCLEFKPARLKSSVKGKLKKSISSLPDRPYCATMAHVARAQCRMTETR